MGSASPCTAHGARGTPPVAPTHTGTGARDLSHSHTGTHIHTQMYTQGGRRAGKQARRQTETERGTETEARPAERKIETEVEADRREIVQRYFHTIQTIAIL